MHIFITRQIPEAGIKLLKKAGHTLRIAPQDAILSRKELIKGVRGADAILSLLTDKIDDEVLKAAGPGLKIVANYAVGFDNIDLIAAAKRGIIVTNTPVPEMSEAVADHALSLILGLAHRVVEADRFTRAKKYKGWSPNLLLGTDLAGKTLGIIGLGRIGMAVAARAVLGFHMRCVYFSSRRDHAFEKHFHATYASLGKVLKTSDFVTLHVPLTPKTRHLISTKQLAQMKPTSYLINTSRGPIVDEKALVRALKSKQIAGAALDVYECEPAIDCDLTDTLELRRCENTILTPHTGSATIEARDAMSICAAKNIIAVLAKKLPLNPASIL